MAFFFCAKLFRLIIPAPTTNTSRFAMHKHLSAFCLVISLTALAQQPADHSHMTMHKSAAKHDAKTTTDTAPAKMAPGGVAAVAKGTGTWRHAVSTTSPEAQAAFDEGLRLT